MSEQAFTPGPWSVGTSDAADYMGIMPTSSYYVEAAGHEVICELDSCGVSEGSEQRAANARLIAAAPAMLAALELAVGIIDSLDEGAANQHEVCDTLALARAALALAGK